MSTPVGESIRRRRGGWRRAASGERPPVRWGRVALFSAVGALAAFGIGYGLAVLILFPAPAAAAPGIVVPTLVGQDTFAAKSSLARKGLVLGSVTSVPDAAAGVGTVVAQDALAGQQLRRGATVSLAVSSGPARASLPNVTGYAVSRAAALLGALGFQVTQQLTPDPAPAGQVVRLSPAPGLDYDLPTAVLLTVSSGPPPPSDTTAADSAAADTGRAQPPGGGAAPLPGTPPAATHPATPVRPAPRDTVRHGALGGTARTRSS